MDVPHGHLLGQSDQLESGGSLYILVVEPCLDGILRWIGVWEVVVLEVGVLEVDVLEVKCAAERQGFICLLC